MTEEILYGFEIKLTAFFLRYLPTLIKKFNCIFKELYN